MMEINRLDLSRFQLKADKWDEEPSMTQGRKYAKGLKLSDELWWVTGGYVSGPSFLQSTEVFNVSSNEFKPYLDLPQAFEYHNVFTMNETHVAIVSSYSTKNIWIFNRSI